MSQLVKRERLQRLMLRGASSLLHRREHHENRKKTRCACFGLFACDPRRRKPPECWELGNTTAWQTTRRKADWQRLPVPISSRVRWPTRTSKISRRSNSRGEAPTLMMSAAAVDHVGRWDYGLLRVAVNGRHPANTDCQRGSHPIGRDSADTQASGSRVGLSCRRSPSARRCNGSSEDRRRRA